MSAYEIEASFARRSDCMPSDSGAVDVDVSVLLDGEVVASGEVTLLPCDRGPGFVSWGARDNWVSPSLLRFIDAFVAGDDAERDLLAEIAQAADAQARAAVCV